MQAAALRGFMEEGYAAICHSGAVPGGGTSARELSSAANGVVLAVRNWYVGQWEKVAKDKDGRGLAGNVESECGLTVRVVGVYGVTGGNSVAWLRMEVGRWWFWGT